MRLEVENKNPVENASAAKVKAAILGLWSCGRSSFASLTDAHGNYLQVAGGRVTCLLERRDASTGRHYRAHGDAPNPVFPDGTLLVFNGGKIALRSDEWLRAPLVVDAFLAFLQGQELPPTIRWRDVSDISGGSGKI